MAVRGSDPSVAERRTRTPGGRRFGFDVDGGWLAALAERAAAAWAYVAFTFEREMEAGRGFLWLPVAFGTGVLGYFALPQEPSALALAVLAAVLVGAAWRARSRIAAFRVLVAVAAVACGVTAAKVRTDTVAAPALARPMTVRVTGWIAGMEEAARGGVRVVVRVHDIEDVDAADTPASVRVTIRSKTDALAVGQGISVLAGLTPPSGPVIPGGYDFARTAFYQRIGAYGFAYGAAKPANLGPPPLAVRLGEPLARLRETIRRRIEAALPGDAGHIAVALTVGETAGISEHTSDAMRASGLGHILAISGLHMALVAGASFWLIRALLAASVGLALARPIKKWAAAGALAVAAAYLGLSGAGVATERAFVMMAIMLTAIMIDRRAITLRNVALAAFVILALAPETLATASFQMSFAATAALISAYEAIAGWLDRRADMRIANGVGARLGWYAASLVVTSLIAGLATTPFAAFHFQRVAPLTLIANLAAMPAVGLVVMPMALMAVVAMPFGLEVLPLTGMKWGLAWVTFVAEKTAGWSTGYGGMAMAPAAALMLVVIGFLWLTLWRERWRLAGLVPMALALPIALLAPRPDLVVNEDGTVAAVRGADGRYSVVGNRKADFEIAAWLRADADPRAADAASLADGVGCDPLGCIGRLAGGGDVALVTRADAFAEDCRRAAIVISRYDVPAGCAAHALVIDGSELDRFGAHALYREEGGFRVETAYPAIRRPFMLPVATK